MPRLKPIQWQPKPGIGYSVVRRSDGGLNVIFDDVSPETLTDWYRFASEHLLNADRLTRNLYDLRKVRAISEEAIRRAVDLNSDPASRNIRLAIVADEALHSQLARITAETPGDGADIRLFSDINAAEAWLAEPLDELV
jgi:hypothetical protein